MTKIFTLKPGQLNLDTIKLILSDKKKCQLDEAAFPLIDASVGIVEKAVKEKKTVYGINTGFGFLAAEKIGADKLKQLQRNLILSHACGTGELLSDELVSLVLLLKINGLAQGYSGVSRKLIEALIIFFNKGIYPCIPIKGSVGASGDLCPLAHLALPLIGEGEVRFQGKILSGEEGLKIAKLKPLQLAPKEGLALINGLQVSAALCIYAFFQAEALFEAAMLAACLSLEAARASEVPFDDRIHRVRGYQAQRDVAAKCRELLTGSTIRESHGQFSRIQDPYSLRCQPQIMGAILHQIRFIGETLQVEVNSVSDNPLVFVEQGDILSGGNFHGEIIAMAADNLALAIAEIGASGERLIALLTDKNFSGLPSFLVQESGLNSGFMNIHTTAAACASDNKALSHPHSVDSIPTSANQEDHVSMSTNAARRLFAMIDNSATIIAIEFLAACQGLEFHKPLTTSPKLVKIYDKIRLDVAPLIHDRFMAPEIQIIKQKILDGDFALNSVKS
ncbi:MAG: histidine ammonia-lyase [Tatlockia sp.]|nr:histidine ammonia-lyase [Tatlockia sp.]